MPTLDSISDVDIDSGRSFKYMLLRISDLSGNSKLIVRGFKSSDFHPGIVRFVEHYLPPGFTIASEGGGYMCHIPQEKYIWIGGSSEVYGPADHTKSAEVLKKHFPEYEISLDK